jgi:hypothetical protein
MPAANCLLEKHSLSDMRNRCRDWTVLGSVLRVPEWRIGWLSREIVAQDGQLQDVGTQRFRRGERVRKRRGRAKVSLRGYRHRTARYVNASWTSVEEEKKATLDRTVAQGTPSGALRTLTAVVCTSSLLFCEAAIHKSPTASQWSSGRGWGGGKMGQQRPMVPGERVSSGRKGESSDSRVQRLGGRACRGGR